MRYNIIKWFLIHVNDGGFSADILPRFCGDKGVNVENQRISLFRQKNKWGLTAAGIAVCAVLAPLLGITLFLPQALAVIPLVLMTMLAFAGPVSATVCSGMFITLAFLLFGLWGSVAVALVIVPVMVVSGITADREQPFWQAVAAGGVTMFASLFAVVALLSMLAGSDVVTALTQVITQGIAASGSLGDTMLSMMAQMGALNLPADAQIGANGMVTMDPAAREELISSIVLTMDSVMRLEIPMRMATASVSCGLLGQAVLRKGLLRRGMKVEYPPLRTWHVPRGWGRILGGTLVLLYVMAQLVPQSMNTMFYVFSGVFDQVFALQGIAMVCYLLHKHGKSRVLQGVVFVLGYVFLGTAAVMLGIADQIMDLAKRRDDIDRMDNPFDPRRNEHND